MDLSESDLKEDSEEWKYIKHFAQVIEVISTTWAHYNNPSGSVSSKPAHFVSSTINVKNGGFRADVRCKFKLRDRKKSGEIFVRLSPETTQTEGQPAYVDQRLQLEQKLSGKISTAWTAIDTGLQLTD